MLSTVLVYTNTEYRANVIGVQENKQEHENHCVMHKTNQKSYEYKIKEYTLFLYKNV